MHDRTEEKKIFFAHFASRFYTVCIMNFWISKG